MGTPLCNGAIDLRELIGHLGYEATARYLINEVQRVFRTTGVFLHDKHLECIVRQMLRYVQVSDPGDTTLLSGQVVDRYQFFDHNQQIWAQGGHPATARPVIFGLTRAILQTSSWIAAASFQETSRVLTNAALSAQTDHLIGLKSRVVVGMRLPTSLPQAM
jgi:DNA-directed RNA polymerase subunit beta'